MVLWQKTLLAISRSLSRASRDAREAAEHGVEMGHEQGSGDAFARDVTEQENEFAVVVRRENQIAIIAADHSGGM